MQAVDIRISMDVPTDYSCTSSRLLFDVQNLLCQLLLFTSVPRGVTYEYLVMNSFNFVE